MKKTNLSKNIILLFLGTLMTKGINLLMIPLFSSWLSTENYGLFDLIVTYISLLLPFITLSNSDAIFRFVVDEECKQKQKCYISTGLLVNVVNFSLTCFILFVIHCFIDWNYILPFVALLFSEIFNNHLQGVTRAIKKLTIYSIGNVITTLSIALAVSILILYFHLGLEGILWGYAIGYFIGELFLIYTIKYWTYLDFHLINITTIKEMICYAYPLIPNNISWWIINVSDRVFINIFLGAVYNGIYAISNKIPNFCASVFNVFSISWQEAAIDVVNSKERDIYYNSIYNRTISTLISLCGGLLSINYFLFYYIFDKRYYEGILYSPILITSIIFSSLSQYFGGIQISLKRPKENGFTTIIGAVINVIIDILLINYIGIFAAALSTLLSNISICFLRYFRLKREMTFKLQKIVYVYIIYYSYLFIMAYYWNNLALNCLNVIIAICFFFFINKNFIINIIKKLKIYNN